MDGIYLVFICLPSLHTHVHQGVTCTRTHTPHTHTHTSSSRDTRTHFPPCQGTAARQILTHTNGFWLLLGNPSILTWVDVLSKIQALARSHQLFMWHRWRVAIRSQAVGLGDLRYCSVAWGDFEKQYPEMRGKKKKSTLQVQVWSQSVCLSTYHG